MAMIFDGKRRVLYIFLSIIVSIAIWAYADSDQNIRVEKTFADIPITYLEEETTLAERGLMLLEDSSKTVSLTLQASRGVIARLDPAQISITVDLSGVTETGWQTIRYNTDYGDVNASGLTLRSASLYMASVHIGELYSRNVNVRCEVQGKVAAGYIAGEVTCQPSTVEIRGDQTEVDKVSYARVILLIDNAKSTISEELEYKLYDMSGQEIESGGNIRTPTDRIQVTLPVNMVKELPLEVHFTESPGCSRDNISYTIQPELIKVSGPADVLNGVDAIVLEDNFDLSTLVGESTYNYVVTVPSGCENLSGITRATMKIRWKDMDIRTFAVTNFDPGELPEGKTASVLTAAINVTLRGSSVDLDTLEADDILVTADLTNVSGASGSYTVPAQVSVNGNVDVGAVGDYQLLVNLQDNTEEEPPATGADPDEGSEPETGSTDGGTSAAPNGDADTDTVAEQEDVA